MITEYLVFGILIATLALFIWGKWRYDVVALMALMATTVTGAIPYTHVFSGFSNPAVITVAAIMVITQAISQSGIVNYAVKRLAPATKRDFWVHAAMLTSIAAVLSAFMNNVGALGLVMPVAIQLALRSNRSPSLILMPIAFGSILGGMTTLIGTPPNIIISTFRQETVGTPFNMFSFFPVGATAAVAGIIFIVFFGWRLIPRARIKQKKAEDIFKIKDYVTEVRVSADSPLIEKTIGDFWKMLSRESLILGLVRGIRKRLNPPFTEVLREGDILIIEASSKELEQIVLEARLELVGTESFSADVLRSQDVSLVEAVVVPGSKVEGATPQRMRLRSRYGINLLAIAREGTPFRQRLKDVRLSAGDVLLLQGKADTLVETTADIGFLPLAERGVQLGIPRRVIFPVAVLFAALLVSVLHILPIQIAFFGAVLVMVLFNVMPIRRVYESIDWSIIILLAAMIPVGGALETTGGTNLIAGVIASVSLHLDPIFILGLVMVITMTLSDVMNNAATAVVMGPIAASLAQSLGYNIDPFLMAVAVGASCAFLTPIGHQNNTLVMGPGGYHFGDYWRMGLPLEIIILVVSLPVIMYVWPLR